jgi:hypothetical protein
MKRHFISVAGFVIAILVFTNCTKKKGEICVSHTTAQVTNVIGPNMVFVNHETDLTVKFYIDNGCGQFERLESTSNGYTTIISLIAKYEGCVCTAIFLPGQIIYKFKPVQTGIYYLKFLQPDKTYLTDTITVN